MSHCIAVTMAMVSGLLFGSLRFSIFAITSKQVHVSKLQTYLCHTDTDSAKHRPNG